jgi:predicted permease
MLTSIRNGVRHVFRLGLRRPDVVREDADAELASYVEARVEQLMARGMSAADARAEAIRRLGDSLESARDELERSAARRDRTLQVRERFEALAQDIRYALRGIRREKAFSAFVILTLALGIGANGAMYGIVDRLLLRGPSHVRDPHSLVRLYWRTVRPSMGSMGSNTASVFETPAYVNVRSGTGSFAGMAAYHQSTKLIGSGAEAREIPTMSATADFFPLLGVRAEVGRFFGAEEDRPGSSERVVVLGHGLWRSDFAGDPSVVGRTVTFGNTQYTVVGVAPRGFTGVTLERVDAWFPLGPERAEFSGHWPRGSHSWWLQVIGRLKPGVTQEQAGRDATAAHQRTYNGTEPVQAAATVLAAPTRYNWQGKEPIEISLSRWLAGVTLIVLLIACANVVNLLLARASRRRQEVAVRLALGAGRVRLVRLLLTESVVLALAGGVLSLFVAVGLGRLIRGVLLPDVAWDGSPVDGRVLALSAIAALGTGILIGLAPAMRAGRADLTAALRQGAREGGGHRSLLRSGLVVAQAALCAILLIGAGLFVRSLSRIQSLDLGLQPDRVLVVSPRRSGTSGVAPSILFTQSVERLRSFPGVEAASTALGLPFRSWGTGTLSIPGRDSIPVLPGGGPYLSLVGSDFFRTIGTRVVQGRAFTGGDVSPEKGAVIVNETMARTLWPGREALGQCLVLGDTGTPCSWVVGVVQDARRMEIQEQPAMQYFVPLENFEPVGYATVQLLVRGSGDLDRLYDPIRRALTQIDPSLRFIDIATLQASIDPQVRPWRVGASVFSLFGVLALLVAAMGLYSVVVYLVAQRTHEIGVRVALGAQGRDVVGLIVRGSTGLAACGVALGVAVALVAGRQVQPLLFDTSAQDPAIIGGVVVVLMCVALVASIAPALRALRIDPMIALRND